MTRRGWVLFAAMFLLWGTGLLLYILLWIFVPDDGTHD